MDNRIVEAMEALQQQDGAIRVLFDAFPQMIWTARPDGQLDYINAPFYAYTNWKPGKAPGNEWITVIHEDDVMPSVERWRRSLQTGDPYEVEQRIKRVADDAYIWHLVRAVPVKDPQGEIIKWLGTSVDIHHQKQIEEQLSSFVYMATHDLKGPVNNMKSLVELFKIQPEKEWGKLLPLLDISVNRLEETLMNVVSNVVNSAIPEKGRVLQLDKLLQEVLRKGLQQEIERSGSRLTTDFVRAPEVAYPYSYLQLIFQTMISQAISCVPGDRELVLHIESSREGEFVLLRFEDNGQDIDLSKDKTLLFKPFSLFYGEKGNNGLGLYLLKYLLEKNGGRIEVESRPGIGTSFLLYLKEYPE